MGLKKQKSQEISLNASLSGNYLYHRRFHSMPESPGKIDTSITAWG
jgi:hypothetical protein